MRALKLGKLLASILGISALWLVVYYLGPGRYGDAVGDSEWLVFRFDSKGPAKERRVVHD